MQKKKWFTFALALVLSLGLFAGCAATPASTPTSSSVAPPTTFEGVVTTADATSLTVQGDKATLTFATDASTAMAGGEVTPNSHVAVVYTGDVASGALATSVTVTKTAETSQTMQGTVVDASMQNIAINTADGNTYRFTKTDDTVLAGDTANGIANGATVTVTFSGDITQHPAATSINIVQGVAPPPQTSDISGTVVSASDNLLTLSVASGHTYSFGYTAATQGAASNAQPGDTATLTYTGELSDRPAAVVINVTAKVPAAPEINTISGTLLDFGADHVSVQVASGHQYTVYYNANTAVTGTLEVNGTVQVNYTGSVHSAATVVSVKVLAPPPATPQVNTITGILLDYSPDHVRVQVPSGNQYNVSFSATTAVSGNLEINSTVQVNYTGSVHEAATAVSVNVLAAAPAPQPVAATGPAAAATGPPAAVDGPPIGAIPVPPANQLQ